MWRSSTGICAIDILLKQKSRQMDSASRFSWKRRKRGRPRFAELRRRVLGLDLAA
jgi:hypothetical protein